MKTFNLSFQATHWETFQNTAPASACETGCWKQCQCQRVQEGTQMLLRWLP